MKKEKLSYFNTTNNAYQRQVKINELRMNNKNNIKTDNQELEYQVEKLQYKVDNLECKIRELEDEIEELENTEKDSLIDEMKYECFEKNHHKFSLIDFQKLME